MPSRQNLMFNFRHMETSGTTQLPRHARNGTQLVALVVQTAVHKAEGVTPPRVRPIVLGWVS